MKGFIIYFLELLQLGGLISLIIYISWTKMTLGATLSLIGAFFPELKSKENHKAKGKINTGGIKIVFRSGLRFVVVFSGLILIIGAVLDGHNGYIKAIEKEKAIEKAMEEKWEKEMGKDWYLKSLNSTH